MAGDPGHPVLAGQARPLKIPVPDAIRAATPASLMTGRRIGAELALAWGLVDEVVVPEDVDVTAVGLAAELAAKPAETLAMIKATVGGMWHGQLHAALRSELLAQVALFGGEDHRARTRARTGRATGHESGD